MKMQSPILKGQRVLIVEDEYFQAFDLADQIADFGANVIGPCASLSEAEELILKHCPTISILDVEVRDGFTFALAKRLQTDGVPLIFVTGFGAAVVLKELQDAVVLNKPARPEVLFRTLENLTGGLIDRDLK